ncbi:MAG: MBL fold metallo-hydrolase [Spirochaetaceae bacterium]|jgi:L-ascorbate metabolism protein UlaG (beta-lactamase superfamily)|nr:MBL fold metallo-hydrolase [Spirochaetaceae bacterium]
MTAIKRLPLHPRTILLLILMGVALTFLGTVSSCASLGKLPSGERLKRIEQSPNYADGAFRYPGALPERPVVKRSGGLLAAAGRILFGAGKRNKPAAPLPSTKTDLFSLRPDENLVVWMGHSSYYMQVSGKKFLVDPVFSGSAFIVSAFAGSDVYTPEDIPALDYLLITHDHWDHLDYQTLKALRGKVGRVLTGLGTGAHLEYWGYEARRIIELDWNETSDLGAGFSITAIATPHFSGRFLTRNKAAWAAFVLVTPDRKIFIGGDSGYADYFAAVGDRYGPFDLVMLECGQYNEQWRNSHMFPEDTAQAALDLRAKKLFAVHWGKFALSVHPWDEPITRLYPLCIERGIPLVHPLIGGAIHYDDEETFPLWWEGLP